MTGEPSRLLPDTDFLMERDKAAAGTVLTGFNGGDPLVDPPAYGYPNDMQVEIERRLILEGDRTKQMNEAVFLNPESGWGEIQAFNKEVLDGYRAQNEEGLIKKPRNEEELLAQMEQMRPVTVDPNRVADIRQKVAKLDQMMKQVDPRSSFFTDPRTKAIGDWINRESGIGTAGFMQSGEQKPDLGVIGGTAVAVAEVAEGSADFGMQLFHGAFDMGRNGILALGGPDLGASYPTNYIQGEDGKIYSNGGKAPAFMDSLVMLGAYATDQNIEQKAAEFGRAREWEMAQREGLGGIARSASRILGMGVGFGLPAGAAMKAGAKLFGGLTEKGLVALGTLRLGKGLAESQRALKIIKTMGAGTGAAVANGALETTAYGRIDGYGHSMMHGMAMAPILMTIGAAGRKTEWFAKNRMKMPAKVAAAVGAGMEGVGFGGMEAHFPDLLPSAWGFVRNPNEDTWETYAKNIMGFMMFKMGTRRSVSPGGEVAEQVRYGIRRKGQAERVARGEAEGPAELKGLGEASMRAREGRTPAERQGAQKELAKIESMHDVAEMGKGPAERVVEQVSGREARKLQRYEGERISALEELQGRERAPQVETPESIAAAREKRLGQRVDPLEDPRLRDLPEATRKEIINEPDPIERKRIFRDVVTERRRPARPRPSEEEGAVAFGRALEGKRSEAYQTKVPGKLGKIVQKELDKAFREAAPDFEATARRAKQMKVQLEAPGKLKGAEAVGRALEGKKTGPYQTKLKGEMGKVVQAELDRAYNEALKLPERFKQATGDDVGDELQQRMGEKRGMAGERAGPQALQMQPTRQIEPTTGVQPVRAMDVYAEMEGRPSKKGFRIPFTSVRIGGQKGDYVRTPIRGGKIKGPALGVFKFFENMIRTKEGRDLAVASHEWSHSMQQKILGKSGKGFVKAAGEQLVEAATKHPEIPGEMFDTLKDYPGAQKMPASTMWMETWAEWHARNLLGEVGLDQKLPAVSRYMRAWLAEPGQAEMRVQYQRIQDMLYRYNAQGALGRVRQSRVLSSDAPTTTEKAMRMGPFQRALRATNKALLDDMVELKKSQEKWLEAAGKKPEDVNILSDPARLYDTLRMTASKTAEHYILRGIRLPDGRHVEGLRDVIGSVKGREGDFVDFLVAGRNMELFKAGKSVQLPPQDYAEAIKQLGTKNPDFYDAASKLKNWTDALVDYVQRSGGISEGDASRIKDAYTVYVPFFRAISGPSQHGQGRGVAERGSGLGRIKGSTYEISDPLVALQQVATSMIAKAHQNQVMAALYKIAAGHEAGGLATVVPRTSVPKTHPLREMLDLIEKKVELEGDKQTELEDIFGALRDADALNPQTITTFTQKVIPTGERSIIAFTPRLTEGEINDLAARGASREALMKQNNKLQWLEVDAKVYESLMGIDKMPQLPESMQPVMRWLQAPRDLVRFFATGVSPGFVAANLVRDAMSAPLFDPQGRFSPFGGFVKMIRGAIEYHKNGKMRELYEELGVKVSSFLSEGRTREVAGQHSRLRDKFLDTADRVQQWFAHPENYIRMSEFKDVYEQSKAAGKSEIESRMLALEAGREITVNFARAGVWARAMNQLVPYFNAGLQGQRKLMGQLLHGGVDTKGDANKARVQRGAVLNGIANITVPATLLWLLNHDEDWYQDLPEWRKISYFNFRIGEQIVSVPKPFEAGVLFGSLPEIMLDNAVGKNPAGVKQALLSVGGPYLEGPGSLVPAFVKPILEIATNKNLFTGRPITPEWIERSNVPSEQATFYTTETAKVLSRVFNGILTPTEIEHLIGGYTAGTSTSAMRALDEITGLRQHPAATTPWARFFKQQPHGQSSYVDQLYELSTELDQQRDTLQPQKRGLRSRVESAKRQISSLRKQNRSGAITREEAERRAYEIARPLIEESNR